MLYKKQIIRDQQSWRNDRSRVSTCIPKCKTQTQTPTFPVPDTPKSLLTRRWMVYPKKKKKTNKPEEKSTCYWETPDNEKMGSLSLQLKKNLSEIFVRCPLNLSLISAWQTSHSLAIDWTSTLSLPATELHIRSSNISPWTTAAEAPSSLGSPDHIMELIRGQSLLCPLPASSHPSCPARTPCTLSITDLHSPHPLSTHCWGISAP